MPRLIKYVVLSVVALLVLAACEPSPPTSQQQETSTQQSNYDQLVARQPADQMRYSPTRDTVNFWIDTWDEPGKLAYVYLMAANGQLIGYYVFQGLPVSYCVSLTPNYRIESRGGGTVTRHMVPAPAMDGVYYSGGDCNVYYGKDATTGTYMEFSVGNGINFLLYEEPLPRQDVEPLGFTTIGQEN